MSVEEIADAARQAKFDRRVRVFKARNDNAMIHDCKEAGCTVDPQGRSGGQFQPAKRPPLDPAIVADAEQIGD